MKLKELRHDGPALVLAAWVVAMIAAAFASIFVASAFTVLAVLDGARSSQRISESAQSTAATWVTLVLSQVAIVGVVLLACRVARARPTERLGLRPIGIGRFDAFVLVAATIVPFVIGLLAASVMPSFGGDSVNGLMRMWAEGSRTTSVLWVLTISLLPGLAEELFYRGFALRGFLMRWPPWLAILASSTLFAVAHFDPAHAAATFIVGIWFGVVAWRTGSVVLPILMHALMNGSWTAIQMIAARSTIADAKWNVAALIAITLGLAAFVLAVRVLRRCDSSAPPQPMTPRQSWTVAGRAAVATLAATGLFYAVLPPGVVKPEPLRPPSVASLLARAMLAATCPTEGEAEFALAHDDPVRIALPPNPTGVVEAILTMDDRRGVIWLAYNGEVTGKGNNGIPESGIIEQLSGDDPSRLRIRFENADQRPVKAWVSLLQDPSRIDAALTQAAIEGGWSTRGRKAIERP